MGGEGAGGEKWSQWSLGALPGRVEDQKKTNGKLKFSGMGAAASSARRLRVLREVLGGAPELIFESPEVLLEPL